MIKAESIGRSAWNKNIESDFKRLVSALFGNRKCLIIGSRFYDFAKDRSALDMLLDLRE